MCMAVLRSRRRWRSAVLLSGVGVTANFCANRQGKLMEPRVLLRTEAATYCGMKEQSFDKYVRAGDMADGEQ